MIAYGYARVSTKGQEESGLGEDAQRASIDTAYKALLLRHQYGWGGVSFDAAVSAGRVPFLEREEGAKLNRKLVRGDAIIVSKVDRAFRRLHDLLNTVHVWDQRGIRVIFADMQGQDVDLSSLAGKAVLFALGFAAEVEWCRASDRCKDKAAAARAQGRPVNQVAPFGYRIGARGSARILYPHPKQRAFARQLVAWWETRSLREIAGHLATLKADGHTDIFTTNHHAVGRYIKGEVELQRLEEGEGITGATDRWLLPNGKVVGLDYFPKQIRELLLSEVGTATN